MNLGLIYKSIRETWLLTLVCGIGVMLFETLIAFVLITNAAQFQEMWSKMPEFITKLITAMLGTNISELANPQQLVALAWVHPVVLAMLWAHEITFCTRVPAGEVDRGTSDILLGWPVTRWQVMVSESVVWMVSGAFLVGLATVGNVLGETIAGVSSRTPVERLLPILCNLYAMYLAVGGLAWLTSTLTDRRGRAIAVAFGVVVISFLVNFLVPFWEPAQNFAFLSVLNYYQPFEMLNAGGWPLTNIFSLVSIGLGLWLVSVLVFSRRNVSTV